ncbi:MAG: carboxy terminal-processing peptidase [Pirellulaceae bacterium]
MHGISRFVSQRACFRAFMTMVLLGAGSAAWWTIAAPLEGPQASDYRVTKVVESYMANDHLSGHEMDDEISRRAMKSFLAGFDPRKMYFYQSDIDEFMLRETVLDDDIKKGQVQFAYQVFDRFLKRLDERVKLLPELVAQDFDFTRDESMITEPDLLQYPRNAAEARDRWRKLVKYNLLVSKADDVDDQKARDKLAKRYKTLARRWKQTDSDELLERFLTAITSSFDPHTTYMSPSTLENFRILMRLNLEGIGAALQINEEGYTVVSKVIPGGAAAKQGTLKKEDRIVSVSDPDTGEMVDVREKKLSNVVQMIRGSAGTVVRLGLLHDDGTDVQIINITRAKIQLEDSAARSVVLEQGARSDGSPFRVGVIDLPSFYMDMEAARESDGRGAYRSTTRDVRKILTKFNAESVDVVVLDLRRNGGASLTEAINLTGLFIDKGPIVQVKDSAGRVQGYKDLDRGMAWKGPLVVITSKFSASASEILAGAIQDYGRGMIVGDETTHGKGTVQSLLDLGSNLFRIPNPPNLGGLKITMQQFYRPNGESTQKRGVLADLILPSITNLVAMAEADLDYAIDFDRVRAESYSPYNLLPADILSRLKARSSDRIAASQDFSDLKKDIERYQRYKDEKTVPLNEEKFMARRETEKHAEKEEEKQFEEQTTGSDEVFRDDFYNREVLAITVDYLKELAGRDLAQLHSVN